MTPPHARRPWLARALPLCLLFLSLAACNTAPEAAPAQDDDRMASVRARLRFAEAAPATQIRVASLVAEAYVPDDGQWSLGPSALGRIEQWEVAIGDTVRAGDPLATLVNYESGDLAGEARAADAAVRQRRAVLQSRLDAQALGVATTAEVEEARSALAEAEASAQNARRAAAARSRGTNTQNGHWRSPVDGVVTAISCPPGAVVGSQDGCLHVVDTSRVGLRVHVPEKLRAQLGEHVTATWLAWGATEDDEGWRVHRRAPTIDRNSRTLAVDFQKDGALLTPGQSGRLDIYLPAAPGWVEIPRRALTTLEGEDVVFVDHDDATLPAALPVRVVSLLESRAVVHAPELAAGASVVEHGTFLLRSLALTELGDGGEH